MPRQRNRFEDLPFEVHSLIYYYAAEDCEPISPIIEEAAASGPSTVAQYNKTGLPILHKVFPALQGLVTMLPKYYTSQVFQFDLRDEVCMALTLAISGSECAAYLASDLPATIP